MRGAADVRAGGLKVELTHLREIRFHFPEAPQR